MFKRALAFALLLCAQLSFGQAVMNATPTYSTATAQTVMPAGSPIYVNNAKLIGRRPGDGSVSFHVSCNTNTEPGCYNTNSRTPEIFPPPSSPDPSGGNGAFRINCSISHQSYDDPIVWPGHPGITHLHTFVGNTTTNFASDLTDMSLTGISTCAGGRVNASGYWMPTPIYHCPAVAIGCDRTRDGWPMHFEANANVYYKCDISGGGPNCTLKGSPPNSKCLLSDGVTQNPNGCAIRWAPVGFRIIEGTAANRAPPLHYTSRFACFRGSWSGGFFDHIPTPAEAAASGVGSTTDANGNHPVINGDGVCDQLNMMFNVPGCWDGVNIDSPTHNTHAIPQDDASSGYLCPDPGYPVPIMAPGMNQHFDIPNQADLAYIRLSSDPACADELGGVAGTANCNGKANNGQPAGWTTHLDWVNGWSHTPNFGGFGQGSATDLILKGCINLGLTPYRSIDCHDINFGSPLNDGIYYQFGN